MTVEELIRIASYLACEWVLAESGEDDVLMWGATMAMRGCTRETILTHMEIRAELIAMAGCAIEQFVDGSKGMIGGGA